MTPLVHIVATTPKLALDAAADVGLGQREIRFYSRPDHLCGLCDLTLHHVGGELPYEMASEVEWMVRRGRARVVVGLTAALFVDEVAASPTAHQLAMLLARSAAKSALSVTPSVTRNDTGCVTGHTTDDAPVNEQRRVSVIAETAKLLLDPRLHAVVDTRTAEGLAKYGQTLDADVKSRREKGAHLMQELLDAIQYAIWQADPERPLSASLARRLASMANELLASMPDLTYEALTFKERHSGAAAGKP